MSVLLMYRIDDTTFFRAYFKNQAVPLTNYGLVEKSQGMEIYQQELQHRVYAGSPKLLEQPESRKAITEIAKNLGGEFQIRGRHWGNDDWVIICEKSSQMFLQILGERTESAAIREAWAEVMVSFWREAQWGLVAKSKRQEPPPLTEGKKQSKELWAYVLAFLQAAIVMKFVIYYFGLRHAEDSDPIYTIGLYVGMGVSVVSLLAFAWRHHQK